MSTRRRSPSNFDYEGAPLIAALYDEADKRGEWTNELAKHLGLSPSYFSSIAGGLRPVSAFNRDTLDKAADYLHVPLVQVYVLAEHLGPEAFLSKENAVSTADRVYDMMMKDSDWSMVAPTREEWKAMPITVKSTIVLLYQKLVQKKMLSAITAARDSENKD